MGALDGKVALVTGAASGIGEATARRFAAEGARVCVVDLTGDGQAVADALDGAFVQADVGDPDDNQRMVDTCLKEFGRLDVAHLNAGVTAPDAGPATFTEEQYRRIMRVNVDGVVYGVRAVIPAMQQSDGGCIVATASLAGLVGFAVDPLYTLTKHAVVGYVRSLPEHLTPLGIRINSVNPGIVRTPLVGDGVKALEEAGFPLLESTDIADAVMKVVEGDGTGECWPVQPGRDPEPYAFRQVPGPRTEGKEGMAPPDMRERTSRES